ncbi:peptide ABC transporter substrate-binding protein [Collinsella sp. An268]|uniref:peptide ABC transporter substrate-binding protein n=1 Tax=Collinsella sp. An268 TaxID=1965612 RepID=UPI000B36A152|nr:peptide ABC transporter substrate-binding protein [Collinsella sp. An268]OUO64541.1 hypothetical protein B5F70_04745 [Collinsella sp. An268]
MVLDRRTFLASLPVAAGAFALAGCTGGDSAPAGSGPVEGDTQNLNVCVASFGNNYDVQDMGWRWMMAACYAGIYRDVADEENGEQFILDGAESIDISDDQTVYTFHLRQDAKWSDGEPVTAHDYVYGWKRLVNPEYGYSYSWYIDNVVGVTEYKAGTGSADDIALVALDDYTFQVTLTEPDATFEAKLVATPLYPTRQDIAEAAGDQWGKDWSLCVYNGPFCMSELVEDNRMVWTKNPEYWDADNVKLESVTWNLIDEDSTAAGMFDNGELDVLQTSGDYSVQYAEKAEAGEIQRLVTDYPGTQWLVFDNKNGGKSGVIGNAKVRKALSYALDRDDIIEVVFGRYKPAYSIISPAIQFDGSSYRDQVDEPLKDEYDKYVGDAEALQELFQEGLSELGMDTDLSQVTITLLTQGSTTEVNSLREYVQQMWQQVLGITVELNTVGDYTLFEAEREAGNYDAYYNGWYSDYNDPLDYLNCFYTGEFESVSGGYSNAEFDGYIDALEGETDNAVRLDLYTKAETLLMEDAAVVPIYFAEKEYFLQNWVKGFCWSSFGASQEFYHTSIEGRGN